MECEDKEKEIDSTAFSYYITLLDARKFVTSFNF